MYLLGQICGLIGTIVTIITPQFRKKEHMMLCNALVNTMSGLNFALIGQAGSAVLLCAVAVVQSFVSIGHERKKTDVAAWENLLFFALYVGFGLLGIVTAEGFVWALTAENLLELLPILGALMLMLSVFARGEQKTRLFLFFNGLVWVVYTVAVGATTFFTCCAAMISSATAMWKYRKTQ